MFRIPCALIHTFKISLGYYSSVLLLGPEGAELRFRLRFFFYSYFWSCRDVLRMRHGVREIKMKDDFNL